MSRPLSQGHRKAQSTSALAVIASTRSSSSHAGPSTSHRHTDAQQGDTARPRPRRSGSTRLAEVTESDMEADEQTVLDALSGSHAAVVEAVRGLSRSRSTRTGAALEGGPKGKERMSSGGSRSTGPDAQLDQVQTWLSEISSLRSSPRRRLAALVDLQKALAQCCSAAQSVQLSSKCFSLPSLLSLRPHRSILVLLTRHAGTLTNRAAAQGHSALSPGDRVATELMLEMLTAVEILQGLCLMSISAKEASSEEWAMEMIIDLLLLLRSQAAGPSSGKTIDYALLELLCAILVDSPETARRFEHRNGLEAVVRVLKGTHVVKDVRMKCIEFLYFYLLPEQSPPSSRSVSSASGSSASSGSSSGESALYPASPLDTPSPHKARPISRTASAVNLAGVSIDHTANMSERAASGSSQKSAPRSRKESFKDLDITFVPETPRKPTQPALGFPTPSMRRASAASSRVVSGVTVIASSPASAAMPPPPVPDTPRRRLSTAAGANTSRHGLASAPSTPRRDSLVAPDLPAATSGMVKSPSFMRNVTAIHLGLVAETRQPHDDLARSSVPSTPTRMSRRESTGVPPSSRDSRAGRMSSRSAADTAEVSSRSSSGTSHADVPPQAPVGAVSEEGRPQKIRHSRTRSQLLNVDELPPVPPLPSPAVDHASPRPQKIRHSRTQSSMAAILNQSASPSAGPSTPSAVASPRSPKIRHSRTQSHLSGMISQGGLPVPPVPPLPSDPLLRGAQTPDVFGSPARPTMQPSTSGPSDRTPSRAKRAFPSDLTRGIPPSASSPALSRFAAPSAPSSPGPLIPSRRVPSGRAPLPLEAPSKIKSVEEKKHMLGAWIGNVDALVSGVEKASFWGAGDK